MPVQLLFRQTAIIDQIGMGPTVIRRYVYFRRKMHRCSDAYGARALSFEGHNLQKIRRIKKCALLRGLHRIFNTKRTIS
jgi:hypothetical protein